MVRYLTFASARRKKAARRPTPLGTFQSYEAVFTALGGLLPQCRPATGTLRLNCYMLGAWSCSFCTNLPKRNPTGMTPWKSRDHLHKLRSLLSILEKLLSVSFADLRQALWIIRSNSSQVADGTPANHTHSHQAPCH